MWTLIETFLVRAISRPHALIVKPMLGCLLVVPRTSSCKEVIQPQVPLRLPCYDFTPVMNHTVVSGLITYSLLVQPTPMV